MTRFTATSRLMLGTALGLALTTGAATADIRFWTTEEQPERLAKQQDMALSLIHI